MNWIEERAREFWKIHQLTIDNKACLVGRCHICENVMKRGYNGICDKHSPEEISDYYDAIEY